MFSWQLWCLFVGIGCAFLHDVAASDCVTREKFESRLLELTESYKREIQETKLFHQKEVRKLQAANEALERRVETLEMLNHQNNEVVVGNENKTTLVDPVGDSWDEHDGLAVSDDIINDATTPNKTMETSHRQAITSDIIKTADNIRKIRRRQENSKIGNARFVVNEVAGRPVAFSVLLNVGDLTSLGANQIIKFDKIVTNIDNVYDMRIGFFTAPISGYYVFSLAVMATLNETQFIYVMRDGVQMFYVWTEGDFRNTATRTMVFQVNKGQEVWVQTSENPSYSHTLRGFDHTSFTGFLLYANDSKTML